MASEAIDKERNIDPDNNQLKLDILKATEANQANVQTVRDNLKSQGNQLKAFTRDSQPFLNYTSKQLNKQIDDLKREDQGWRRYLAAICCCCTCCFNCCLPSKQNLNQPQDYKSLSSNPTSQLYANTELDEENEDDIDLSLDIERIVEKLGKNQEGEQLSTTNQASSIWIRLVAASLNQLEAMLAEISMLLDEQSKIAEELDAYLNEGTRSIANINKRLDYEYNV